MTGLTEHQREAARRLSRIDPAAEQFTADTAGLGASDLDVLARVLTRTTGIPAGKVWQAVAQADAHNDAERGFPDGF